MAKASKKEKLVTRVVVGPKGIHHIDPKTGERRYFDIGEPIQLSAKSAKAFARYLEAPGVTKARAAVKEAENADSGDDDNEIGAIGANEAEAEAEAESKGGASGDGS